jgi:chemotaxis protein CheD
MGKARSQVVVGVADCRISSDLTASIVTYALGSCVAVAIHDPVARVGGMLHLMLPDSSLDTTKAGRNPYMFADTGIPMLFRRAYAAGADKKRLVVHIAGGAQVMDDAGLFNIGKRNYLTVKKVLWRAGVIIRAESVGGRESRTVRLEVDSGRFLMRTAGGAEQDLDQSSFKREFGTKEEQWHQS